MGKRDKREVADMFKALGDPTRLSIYQFLQERCWPHSADTNEEHWMTNGPTVSEVSIKVTGSKKITSKVSQHLKELRISGLITIERRGKNMICGVNHAAASFLAALLNCAAVKEPAETAVHVDERPIQETVIQEEPVKAKRKVKTIAEAPVVELEVVKPRRKAKASSNGEEPPTESSAVA